MYRYLKISNKHIHLYTRVDRGEWRCFCCHLFEGDRCTAQKPVFSAKALRPLRRRLTDDEYYQLDLFKKEPV